MVQGNLELLGPLVALVAWTLVVLVFLAFKRARALKRAGINVGARRGGRGQDLDGVVEPEAQWPAHNYMHLVEQPTLFYAMVLALTVMGMSVPINVWLAWAYVALRIVHSLVQIFDNRVTLRLPLFLLSTLCLLGLTVHAAAFLIHHH
jgi:hypothetical protein